MLLISLGLVACGPSGGDGSGGGASDVGLTKVRIGTQPYYDYQFFKIAHDLGVDREFGLDLVDVPEPGQTAYPQLARGDIDIAASCESCALPAIANFPTLRNFMITELFKGFVLIGRATEGAPERQTFDQVLSASGGDPQKAAADFVATLRGRSFAINPAADGALLGALLSHAGLTPNDVQVIAFPDEATAALAFISGSGDYYFGSLPQELRMLTSPDLRGRFIEAGPAELFPLNYANFAATSQWLDNNEDTAVRLVAVWFRVTRYLYEKPDRLLKIMSTEMASQTGGVLTDEQTRIALTEFMFFAPYEKAYATYFDPKSSTFEGIALSELYQQAEDLEQIPQGTDYSVYETSAHYFALLTQRPDLLRLLQAPLS